MTPEQVVAVAEKYIEKLTSSGFSMENNADSFAGSLRAPQHALWMCEQLRDGIAEADMEKACRWLGFIQGVLWSRGTFSINEMREHNRR